MPKPSLDTLQTPANAQVFALAKQLSKSAVERAFDAADAKADGRAVFKVARDKRSIEGSDYFASLISFPLTGPSATRGCRVLNPSAWPNGSATTTPTP
jgi:hypothetical protein